MTRRAAALLAALAGAAGEFDGPGALGLGCRAGSEEDCLVRPGCRWFSYDPSGGCPLCEAWFGPAAQDVSGCRSWEVDDWCSHTVFREALARYDGRPDDDEFRYAISRYQVSQGNGEFANPHQKRAVCSVWCDFSEPGKCTAKLRAKDEVKGVNYGGRLIPEYYLQMPGSDKLFSGIRPPEEIPGASVSLCDVARADDARQRLTRFLDLNIKPEHFEAMATQGFNTVRLPLGYWELVGLPGNATPNSLSGDRWRHLQYIMPASAYMKWINNVFEYAERYGLKVLLDLHGGPGGQTDNVFTGCDQGRGMYFFDTPWNRQIAVQAIERMAEVCNEHGDTCYGIELLNEPIGSAGPGGASQQLSRAGLRDFYLQAIGAARKHMDWDKPILIMDWPAWLPWWKEKESFDYSSHGRIVFSTHVYHLDRDTTRQETTRALMSDDLRTLWDFHWRSKYELVVSEYALSGHGSAFAGDDPFDYSSLGNWMASQFRAAGLGSMVWNFDAAPWLPSWGAVAATKVGNDAVDWRRILTGTPRSRDPQITLI